MFKLPASPRGEPTRLNIPTRQLIVGVIVVLVTLELGWGAWVLWGPKVKPIVTVNPPNVTFALSPETGSFAVGEPFEVALNVLTNGRALSGVDVSLQYDPRMLRVETKGSTKSAVFATSSALFDMYPTNQLNRNTGKIDLSAIRSAGRTFNGTGTLGKVRFIPLSTGKAEVKFIYEENGTTDSNAADAESGKDVLGQVVGGVYEIR